MSSCCRSDYHQVDEQDPFLPPSAASQAIAARTLRGQGSYPPTAPPLNPNIHGNQNTIKQPLLLTPPPPSYATATARARQLHESMLKFVHESFFIFLLYFFVRKRDRCNTPMWTTQKRTCGKKEFTDHISITCAKCQIIETKLSLLVANIQTQTYLALFYVPFYSRRLEIFLI